jgi:hypothetical protein
MAIFRQYIAPLIVVLIFCLSLVAVSARIFLPQDMAAPAPIEESDKAAQMRDANAVAELPAFSEAPLTAPKLETKLETKLEAKPETPRLDRLVKGLTLIDDAFAPQLAPQL